jgi:hypothetical protein
MTALFKIFSIQKLQTYLVIIAVSLSLGFYAGWSVKSKLVQAEVAAQLQKALTKSEESKEKSDSIEKTNIETKVEIQIRYKTKIKEVIKHVPETKTASCTDASGNSVATTLTVGAVELLNSTGESKDVQPASLSDAESQAATEVGLRELSEHIIEIKQQYEELATDHNSLVDYNNWYKSNIDAK